MCCVCVLSDVDKCRRSSGLMVTYNPSFSSSAEPLSPATAAAAAAGGLAVSTEDSVTSPASSTSTSISSFSPQSPSRPLPLPRTSSRDGYQQPPAPSQPLHRPHSVTGLCLYLGSSLTGTVPWSHASEGPTHLGNFFEWLGIAAFVYNSSICCWSVLLQDGHESTMNSLVPLESRKH